MPPDTAGKPPRWRRRSETEEASWGTTVAPPLYTTHCGLLKQPDNQKTTKKKTVSRKGAKFAKKNLQNFYSCLLLCDLGASARNSFLTRDPPLSYSLRTPALRPPLPPPAVRH